MAEITLEAVLARLEALERKVAEQAAQHAPPARKKDWRRVAGMFTDSGLMREIDAEGQAVREADREGRPVWPDDEITRDWLAGIAAARAADRTPDSSAPPA